MRSTKYWIVGLLLLLLGAGDTFAAETLPAFKDCIIKGELSRRIHDRKASATNYVYGGYDIEIFIPVKTRYFFSRTAQVPQYKIISITDDQGRSLLDRKTSAKLDYGYVTEKSDRVYGDALVIEDLTPDVSDSKTIDIELEVTLQKGSSYKTTRIKDIKDIKKGKDIKMSSGSMSVSLYRDHFVDVLSDFPVEILFAPKKKKRHVVNAYCRNNDRILQRISIPSQMDDGALYFRYPTRVTEKKYIVSAKGLKLFPDDWKERYHTATGSAKWQKRLSRYVAYTNARSETIPNGSVYSLICEESVHWEYDGKKQIFSDRSYPSLGIAVRFPFPGRGKNIKEYFTRAVFFRPLQVQDDTGKNLIGDRISVGNGRSWSGSADKRYNVHRTATIRDLKMPDPKAKKITIFSGDLYCDDGKDGFHNFKIEFKDIPIEFDKDKAAEQGNEPESSTKEEEDEKEEK